MINAKENQAKFEKTVFENIKREGIADMMDFLFKSDFYTAPASTKFHLACEGGLCDHSLRVYGLLENKFRKFFLAQNDGIVADITGRHNFSESMAIAGLFHDICKVGFYIKTFVRNPEGKIVRDGILCDEKYEVEDLFPTGHGEKSAFILQRFIKLTDMEIAMIRWHMATYDPGIHFDYPNGYAFRNAVKLWPAIYLMITADLEATMLENL